MSVIIETVFHLSFAFVGFLTGILFKIVMDIRSKDKRK